MNKNSLQLFLQKKFVSWTPLQPEVINKSHRHVTLKWDQENEPFGILSDHFLYKISVKDKVPPWRVVYSGAKTTKKIDDLASGFFHKFRLQVILKGECVPEMANEFLRKYSDEESIHQIFSKINPDKLDDFEVNDKSEIKRAEDHAAAKNNSSDMEKGETMTDATKKTIKKIISYSSDDDTIPNNLDLEQKLIFNERGDSNFEVDNIISKRSSNSKCWLESLWSEEVWVTTDTEGTSAACFCMAVQCGYLKQVQQNLEEKPDLVNTLNAVNGRTPLITAVIKGNSQMVTLLIGCDADVNQKSTSGCTALHLAIYHRHLNIAQTLLERGANIEEVDVNGLQWVHMAVDSGSVEVLQFVLENGGDTEAKDSNGWTPLFRAVCQGASDEMIKCLCDNGADINVRDFSGLPLQSIALLLTDKRGNPREAVLRLVDANYPHEIARVHFTRLTRKINRILKVTTLT